MKTNQPKLSHFIQKALALTDEQRRKILENHKKISIWLGKHPGEEITEDKVAEIVATEIEEKESSVPEPTDEVKQKIEESSVPGTDYGFREERWRMHVKENMPKETVEQVGKLTEMKEGKILPIEHRMSADVELAKQVDDAFKGEVDDYYGKKLLFMKTPGVEAPEWKFMRSLPAAKVVEYYKSDSANSSLGPEVAKELTDSAKHQKFIGQMVSLMEQTKGTVRPYENESVEQFFKRLGYFVMREHLNQTPKAA